MQTIQLNNGQKLPAIGFGTYDVYDVAVFQDAIAAGYTLFDNAPNYANLEQMGRALNESGRRSELFLTEKIETSEQPYGAARALRNCLKATGQAYVDLYLMHFPHPDYYLKTWREMEALCRDGLVRGIGVCNFSAERLKRLLDRARIVPAVNQIELHPLFQQQSIVDVCRENGIAVMAYSPLARMDARLFGNPAVTETAVRHGKTAAQIVLRWALQTGVLPIPKTADGGRMRQNLDVFDFCLTDAEMADISALECGARIRKDPDDPSIYPKKPRLLSVCKTKLRDRLMR